MEKLPPRAKDFTKVDFEHLRSAEYLRKQGDNLVWQCTCKCGVVFERFSRYLRSDSSCTACTNRLKAESMREHGMTDTPTYVSWQWTVSKGATWMFDEFLEQLGERPDGSVLRRVDPQQPYSKSNCCWVGGKAGYAEIRKIDSKAPQMPQNRRKARMAPGHLSDEKVRQIRSWFATGVSGKKAAAKLGISKEWFARIGRYAARTDVI